MPAPLDPECIFTVLHEHEVEYVLIGGLAAVLHGSPTMTNDADIYPAVDRDNLIRLSGALRDVAARFRSPTDPEGVPFEPHPELLATMTNLTMHTRCGDLDVAFSPAALEYESVAAASHLFEINKIPVHVAALADIIRSKAAAGRAKDHATLPILRALQEEIDGSR